MAHCAKIELSSNEAANLPMTRGTAVSFNVLREAMTFPVRAALRRRVSHGALTVSSATSLAPHYLFSRSDPEHRRDNNSK